ncbi:MAG: ZIP family metal transporter [Nanoarchaeota archaeon]|nr:ZIP family metal transporter [Nanoarchaeota archaeon]
MNFIYPIISVIIVSLISIVVAIPLLIKKKLSTRLLLFLLSISVGVLLSTVFLNFLPEMIEHGYTLMTGIYILLGFVVMFILEKFIHFHHHKKCETGDCGHGHAYNVAPVNLIGDGIHNFIDGLVIAGAYAVNITLGIAATVSIIFHEVPQEIADFGVLLYSGLSKKKALVFNFVSAATAIVGTVLGFFLIEKIHGFTHFIIPFAAGNFIYIAASNLLPQLHRHCKLKDTILHLAAIFIGIAIIVLVILYAPVHAH